MWLGGMRQNGGGTRERRTGEEEEAIDTALRALVGGDDEFDLVCSGVMRLAEMRMRQPRGRDGAPSRSSGT